MFPIRLPKKTRGGPGGRPFDRGFLGVFKVKAYVVDVRFERLMASDITKRISESISERSILPIEVLLSCGRMTESRLMLRAF